MSTTILALLDDPTYQPKHPPVDGRVPAAVARWATASQLRWFRRYRHHLAHGQDLAHLHTESPHHTDWCCAPCQAEYEQGRGVMTDGWCCCHDARTGR
ncbi:hypothetical protein ACF06P_35465 [Streptomyces sp. NPDC015684]|uniref:hypothetical protein n=1 Tax=Streptomyces sp. NPDC015684 TaxID=3364963 RepID=UPI00370035BB